VLKFLFTAILAILTLRLFGSLAGLFGQGRKRRSTFDRSQAGTGVEKNDYRDLTPYEIEDAEYEDLPKRD
jgi:hypothetical protein